MSCVNVAIARRFEAVGAARRVTANTKSVGFKVTVSAFTCDAKKANSMTQMLAQINEIIIIDSCEIKTRDCYEKNPDSECYLFRSLELCELIYTSSFPSFIINDDEIAVLISVICVATVVGMMILAAVGYLAYK